MATAIGYKVSRIGGAGLRVNDEYTWCVFVDAGPDYFRSSLVSGHVPARRDPSLLPTHVVAECHAFDAVIALCQRAEG